MPLHECAGPNRKPKPVPQEIKCPHCGAEAEMWTNEDRVKCPKCKKEITREQLAAKR